MLAQKNVNIKLNVYYDKQFKFQISLSSLTTVKDLKTLMVQRLGIYSVNYLIEYKDKDYTNFESFTIGEIFIFVEQDREYDINLKDIETYVRERKSQRVMITYEEGGADFYIYNLFNMKFEKIPPEKSKRLKFDKFPFNCRSVHIKKENRLMITGGIGFETGCCSYDYDTNYIMEHPDCKRERQMHSMVNLDDMVFLIGGLYSKSVDCFNLDFEDWTEYPQMNYDRKDPSTCVVDKKYLYVFMGYSQTIGGVAENFERLDISTDAFSTDWELLPINNPVELPVFRTQSCIVPFQSGFLLLGGFLNYKSDKSVFYFDLEDYSFKRSKYVLPFEAGFNEKEMFSIDSIDDNLFYVYTLGSIRLLRLDFKKTNISEVVL